MTAPLCVRYGLRRPQQLLVVRVPVEGLDAVAAVRLHHRRVVVHGEVDRDVRILALAEASTDEVRNAG